MNDLLYYLGVLVVILGLVLVVSTIVFTILLKFSPTSNLSGWIRRHLISDEDLEP